MSDAYRVLREPQASPPANGGEVLSRLRAALEEAQALTGHLGKGLAKQQEAPAKVEERIREMERRLNDAEEDRTELSRRLVEVEVRSSQLMSLYVATYQLHATLEPQEVHSAIAEVTTNLLGAESFVLLLSHESSEGCRVVLRQEVDDQRWPTFAGHDYVGGDNMVDATLEDGSLRLGHEEGSSTVAAVPLTVEGVTVGALVILSLLAHKGGLVDHDRELLDLLAAHAASALFAAEVYANTQRKLRTLEGLMQLVKRA